MVTCRNKWARVVSAMSGAGSRVSDAQWAALCSGGALAALCACVAAGGPAQHPAADALRAAARHYPLVRPHLVAALLNMDAHAHANGTSLKLY